MLKKVTKVVLIMFSNVGSFLKHLRVVGHQQSPVQLVSARQAGNQQ